MIKAVILYVLVRYSCGNVSENLQNILGEPVDDVSENLKNILGEPVDDVAKAESVRGIKRTTTVHKICSKLRQNLKHLKIHENNIIKQRCGVLNGKDQQYDTQSQKVADVIQHSHKSKATLKQQREQLIREVNKLAKLAGPLPSLKIAG